MSSDTEPARSRQPARLSRGHEGALGHGVGVQWGCGRGRGAKRRVVIGAVPSAAHQTLQRGWGRLGVGAPRTTLPPLTYVSLLAALALLCAGSGRVRRAAGLAWALVAALDGQFETSAGRPSAATLVVMAGIGMVSTWQ